MGMVVSECFPCEAIEAVLLYEQQTGLSAMEQLYITSAETVKTEQLTISVAENGLNSPTLSVIPLVACVIEAS